MDYSKVAAEVIEAVGKENLIAAAHCATRLRLVLKDEAKEELGAGKTFTNIWFNYVKYIVPIIILVIFFSSI